MIFDHAPRFRTLRWEAPLPLTTCGREPPHGRLRRACCARGELGAWARIMLLDLADVDTLVARLGLVPQSGGGFYRETYRAGSTTGTDRGERPASTAIYFLLRRGDMSALHRIASDEVWHFHAGAPLTVVCLDARGRTDVHLGSISTRGKRRKPSSRRAPGSAPSAKATSRWSAAPSLRLRLRRLRDGRAQRSRARVSAHVDIIRRMTR